MGIFSRLSDIVNSNINALLDKAEDPEKIIRLIIQEMEDTLVEVRSDAVRIIADRKESERQIARLTAERDDWEAKAELAITKGREDLARAALIAKTRVGDAVNNEAKHLDEINKGLDQQGEDIARLQAKLDDARKREALDDLSATRPRPRGSRPAAPPMTTVWSGRSAGWRRWKALS